MQTSEEAAAQVQKMENNLSPQQQAALAQLQNGRRKMLQGPATQASIATINQMDQVNGAEPYPYDSWAQAKTEGVQTSEEAAAQVQKMENNLSPQQQAALAQLQQQQ